MEGGIGILANSRLDGRFLRDKTKRTSNAMSEEQELRAELTSTIYDATRLLCDKRYAYTRAL